MKPRIFTMILLAVLLLGGVALYSTARTAEPMALQDRIAKLKAEINTVPLTATNYPERIQTMRDWGNVLTDRGHFFTQQDLQLNFVRNPEANADADAALKQWFKLLSFVDEKGAQMGTLTRTDKNELQAGQFSTIVLEYTVGAAEIPKGAGLRLGINFFNIRPRPQSANPADEAFTSFKVESKTAQTKIIVARHGASAYDPARPQLVNGVPDPPLAEQGKEEALRLARLAQAEGVEVIVHSPLRRARETAEIVGRELKLKPVPMAALSEFNLGDLLGKDWSQSPYREQLAEVLRHPDNKRPGGESFNELSARATKALQELRARHRDKRILLIAHGYTNRALLGSLRGLSTADAYALPSPANNEVILVRQAGDVDVQAVTAAATTEAEKWRADLRFMAEEMPRTHKNLFHTMTREQFDAAVKALHERIPQLARHQIIVELMRIVAMVGDGHTNIAPTRDPKIGFRALPVRMYLFQDGLFIRAAPREQAALVGARVVMIGNATAAEAVARAIEITGRDNEMGARYFAPFLLAMPEALHALGLAATPDEAQFVIEQNGRRQTVTLKPIGLPEMMLADTDNTWLAKVGWVDLRDQATAPVPLWLKDQPNLFWFEYLPESKIVYAQINQVRDKDKETLAAFSQRLFAFIAANPVEKLVLDVRLNRGGDGGLLRPLVTGIIKSKVDQPGRLFAIMGRSTWSAAQFLLNDLEQWTNVTFVGEPSGSKGNHYGDSRKITLPHSGITVRVSIYQWLDWSPWDLRQWTAPHLTAELTAEDYRNNADPALQVIQHYKPQKPLAEVLEEGLAKNDLALTARLFRQFKAEPLNRYLEVDTPMIELGYRLLREKRLDAGLLILLLNVEVNPRSANAHGALADAYYVKGNKELAIKHYEKSFDLHPGNFDVRDKLKQLRQ